MDDGGGGEREKREGRTRGVVGLKRLRAPFRAGSATAATDLIAIWQAWATGFVDQVDAMRSVWQNARS